SRHSSRFAKFGLVYIIMSSCRTLWLNINKLILITGASLGIGLSISQKFASAGANLILISHHQVPSGRPLSTLPPGGEHQYVTGEIQSFRKRFGEGVGYDCSLD